MTEKLVDSSSGVGIQRATEIFRALAGVRLTEKYKAIEELADPRFGADLPTLRTLLRRSIAEDFYVGRETELDDPQVADTRSWLLNALARVAAGAEADTEFLIEHIDQAREPSQWARYWALEGLITGKNQKAEAVSKLVSGKENDPLVSMLGTAYLASLKDGRAIRRVKDSLVNTETRWVVLRALRVVPLPSTVKDVAAIVDAAQYNDLTYDAIMALGVVAPDWPQADIAAQSLSGCIVKLRGAPWMDGMRTGAIAGLGKLRAESAALVLIEELSDDNPAIVREAARSMERTLGLNLAVMRIVETATKGSTTGIDAWGRALRWLNREAAAEELGRLMVSGSSNQQEVARVLLSELGGVVAFEKLRVRTDAMKQYTDVLQKAEEGIRDLFDRTIREAQSGFLIATILDLVVFGLGVALLAASAVYALRSTGNLANWAGVGVSAGTGFLGVLYGTLVAKPRRQIRESVDHLMGLKVVFLAYLRRLHQADQAYTRRMLDDRPLTIDEVRRFSEVIDEVMTSTIAQQRGDLSARSKKPREPDSMDNPG